MERHDRRLGDRLEEVGVDASEHACVAHRQRERPGQRTEAERDHEEQRPDQVGNRAQEPCDAPRREAQQREWSSLAAIEERTAPPQARGGEDSQAEPEKRSGASATSWSSATNVRPSQMRNNRSASWAVRPGSSEANGSSASTTGGSCTSTRANATRCCCPPDSSSTRAAARSARPTV